MVLVASPLYFGFALVCIVLEALLEKRSSLGRACILDDGDKLVQIVAVARRQYYLEDVTISRALRVVS